MFIALFMIWSRDPLLCFKLSPQLGARSLIRVYAISCDNVSEQGISDDFVQEHTSVIPSRFRSTAATGEA